MILFKFLAKKLIGHQDFISIISCKSDRDMKSLIDNIGKCNLLDNILKYHSQNSFTTNESQLEQVLSDTLQEDSFYIEITGVATATQLLNIKHKINNTPLVAMERSIYLHIVDLVCEEKFNTWSVERAAEKEKEDAAGKRRIGFIVDNTVVDEGAEIIPNNGALKEDNTSDSVIKGNAILADAINSVHMSSVSNGDNGVLDICLSRPVAILDEAGKKSGWYKQIVSKVNSLNDNIRIYPKEVYQPALDELKGRGFPYAGEHPHPPSYMGKDKQIHFKTSVPNSAVKFRNAYIDNQDNVWAEYRTLETEMGKQVQSIIDAGLPIGFSNRMTGMVEKQPLRDSMVEVAKTITLYAWDVLMNPAEKEAFSKPIPITDDLKNLISNNKEDNKMDFFAMSLQELKAWKASNAGHAEMVVCDNVIALKEKAETAEGKASTLTDEIQSIKAKEEREKKAKEAQSVLTDEVGKLPFEQKIKDAIIQRGKAITDAAEVTAFVEAERALVDAVTVNTRLTNLGIPTGTAAANRATIIETSEQRPGMAIIDGLMTEMDRELIKKDANFKIDRELRKANLAILDSVLAQLERDNAPGYMKFMHALKDELSQIEMVDSMASTPAISTTGEFAQASSISLAILRQTWQDLKFLQLSMTEGFDGTTYRMPVEWQSSDLYSEDDFNIGELEGIPTESVQTFFLEFGAEWLKRGFIVTKEAEEALKTGPFKYNIIAANAANIANRFARSIDRKISTEMISRADEYCAKQVKNEIPEDSEIVPVMPGINAPNSTNAKYKVKLLCGKASPFDSALVPPIVRPRVAQWLNITGRLEKSLINEIIVKDSAGNILIQGLWNTSKGQILPMPGVSAVDYAVDFENAEIYFVDGVITMSDKPTIMQYSYATNIAFFNLTVPDELKGHEARYYNKLLELVDIQQAYMGSAPRYVTPDFLLGSLQAMVPYRQAELFWKLASPDGTSLLGGEMYFGRRNGIELGAHNAPWVAGDSRLLLGKRNATRVGMGSSYSLEGPFPHLDKLTGNYTSAKVWNATQQIAINTPLVIDGNFNQYHPPYRTIKYYNS